MLRASSLGLTYTNRFTLTCRICSQFSRLASSMPVIQSTTQDVEVKESEHGQDVPTEEHCVTNQVPYATGRPWRSPPINPLRGRQYPAKAGEVPESQNASRFFLNTPPQVKDHLAMSPSIDSLNDSGVGQKSRVPYSTTTTAFALKATPPRDFDHGIKTNLLAEGIYAPDIASIPKYQDTIPLGGPALRRHLLHILGTTDSVTDAWEAYSMLVSSPHPAGVHAGKNPVPLAHLHRLSRILARARPKTRTVFLQLLAVLRTIRQSGGIVKLHQWNALIDNAGKGWRKTTPEDFKLAFDVFNDLRAQRSPGATLSGFESSMEAEGIQDDSLTPDVVTYTTLISIAARTSSPSTIRQATALLRSSGIPPNRITHLSMLRYFTDTKQLSGIQSTLTKMSQQGLELGLDGLNACLWAFAHTDQVDIVKTIYRVLRHNIWPEQNGDYGDSVKDAAQFLRDDEKLLIPDEMRPNEITFTTVVQILSYDGDLSGALNVFLDMMSSQNLEAGAPLLRNSNGDLKPSHYSPTLPIFRAIFLGFARHGVPPSREKTGLASRLRSMGRPAWDHENLRALYDTFMTLPEHIIPSNSTIYWIMVAFAKTTKNDSKVLREVWLQLEDRFKGPWGGPTNRLQRLKANLFPSEINGKEDPYRGDKMNSNVIDET